MINADRYEEVLEELRDRLQILNYQDINEYWKIKQLLIELSIKREVYKYCSAINAMVLVGHLNIRDELFMYPPIRDTFDNSRATHYYNEDWYIKEKDVVEKKDHYYGTSKGIRYYKVYPFNYIPQIESKSNSSMVIGYFKDNVVVFYDQYLD